MEISTLSIKTYGGKDLNIKYVANSNRVVVVLGSNAVLDQKREGYCLSIDKLSVELANFFSAPEMAGKAIDIKIKEDTFRAIGSYMARYRNSEGTVARSENIDNIYETVNLDGDIVRIKKVKKVNATDGAKKWEDRKQVAIKKAKATRKSVVVSSNTYNERGCEKSEVTLANPDGTVTTSTVSL